MSGGGGGDVAVVVVGSPTMGGFRMLLNHFCTAEAGELSVVVVVAVAGGGEFGYESTAV